MIWNTIAHPKMMIDSNPVGVAPHSDPDGPSFDPDDTTESVIEGIKYADPHKLAFFDLLIDISDAENPKLIHGDFETIKKKLFNHELVIGGKVLYDGSTDMDEVGIEIKMAMMVAYNYTRNAIMLNLPSGLPASLLPDNTVRVGGIPVVPGDDGGGTVGPTPNV